MCVASAKTRTVTMPARMVVRKVVRRLHNPLPSTTPYSPGGSGCTWCRRARASCRRHGGQGSAGTGCRGGLCMPPRASTSIRGTTWLPQFSVVRIDTVRSVVSSKSAHAKIRVDTGVPVSTGVKLHNPLVRHTTVERLGEAPACTAKQRGKESCLTTCLYGDHAQCVTQCVGYDARARAFPSISVVSSRVGAGRRTLY